MAREGNFRGIAGNKSRIYTNMNPCKPQKYIYKKSQAPRYRHSLLYPPMKTPSHPAFVPILSVLLILLTALPVSRVRAEAVLEVIFNDPDGVMAGENPAAQKAPFRGKNIATSTQAKALPVLAASPKNTTDAPELAVRILTEPPMHGPFLRASQHGGTTDTQTYSGVEIVPDFDGASLAALATVERDKITLQGGFDIFFRAAQEPQSGMGTQFKILDCSAKDGLRFIVGTDRNHAGIFASLIRQGANHFDTDLDGSGDADQISTQNSASGAGSKPVESGKIYHAAVSFATDAEGIATMKVFLKEGLGAIDTAKTDDLTGEARFRLLNVGGKLLNGFPKDKIVLGTFPTRPVSGMDFDMDFAAFRIFIPAPEVFPGLTEE